MMILSVGGVVTLFVWCIYRVLFHRPKPPPEHLHGFDINTRDRDTD